MTNQAGPDKGQVRLGIYDVQSDQLKLHFLPGEEATKKRPANFDGDVILLIRDKSDKK